MYEQILTLKLKPRNVPEGKLELDVIFCTSNKLSDVDNFLKPFIDILQKKYGFNDRDIYKICVTKEIVKKGEEGMAFEIRAFTQ
mgnify:FL=1